MQHFTKPQLENYLGPNFNRLKEKLATLSNEDRLAAWRLLMEDYCEWCGRFRGQELCHCNNDA